MKKGLTEILLLVFILSGTVLYAGNNKHFNIDPINKERTSLQQSEDYKLYQNFPNPFNPVTKISYKISREGTVTLKVYNLVGQVVGTLVNEKQNAGTYEVDFDASELTSGVYLYKLQINGFTSVKRMTVIK
ncbi:MAG: T9SS type A sorting domain-containing protein [Ignavibacteria bacterium]|nr:T9SS type A sorting domain-containing protein [Ignavibacteria bacterium]